MLVTPLTFWLVFPSCQAEPHVTKDQKTEFLEKLGQWPHHGEFFAAEAVLEARPYVPVLFALTDQDIKSYITAKTGKPLEKVEGREYDIYPFMALSADLVQNSETREYAVKHFREIAHPEIKLSWAVMIFDRDSASPEIVRYLRSALESKERVGLLKLFVGPDFEKFQQKLTDYRSGDNW